LLVLQYLCVQYGNGKRARTASAAQSGDKAKRAKSGVTSSPESPSLLLALPAEITRRIVDYLPPADYLKVKFTCKQLNAATKCIDGIPTKKLRDIFEKFNLSTWPHHLETEYTVSGNYYSQIMADLESGLSAKVNLLTLTCSSCGDCLGRYDANKQRGFDDLSFNRVNASRRCLLCYTDHMPEGAFKVRNVHYCVCNACGEIMDSDLCLRVHCLSSMFKSSTRWDMCDRLELMIRQKKVAVGCADTA